MNNIEGKEFEFSPCAESLNIPMSEVYRSMGYGEAHPEEGIVDLCEQLLREAYLITKPRLKFKIASCNIENERLEIGEKSFGIGRTISSLLRKSSQGLIFVATAGEEFQEWMEKKANEGDILQSFIVDAIGSTIAEAAGDYMEHELKQILTNCSSSLKHTNRFSPGYCGWNIEEQAELFSYLDNKTCGITLNSSSLMHPTKSISGVIGIGENVLTKKYGCDICQRDTCYMRRAK